MKKSYGALKKLRIFFVAVLLLIQDNVHVSVYFSYHQHRAFWKTECNVLKIDSFKDTGIWDPGRMLYSNSFETRIDNCVED